MTVSVSDTDRGARTTGTVVVLCAGGITASLAQTSIIPLIPQLPHLFDTSPAGASWVLTSTLLTGAVAMPVSGRLGDLFGKRRLLSVCLLMLLLGSVVCALATTLVPMIAGRAMQGLAMGVVPLGMSLMRDVLPAGRLPVAAATMSSSLGVGGAVALPVGAVMIDLAGWRSVFWASALVTLVAWVALLVVVQGGDRRHRGYVDLPGALLLSAGLVALLLLVSGSAGPVGSTPFAVVAALAVLTLVGGALFELRQREPFVDLRLAATPRVLWVNGSSWMLGFGMYVTPLTFPLIISAPLATGYGLGLSVTQVGLILAPGGAAMMLTGPVAARLSVRYGARVTLIAGALAAATGYAVVLVAGPGIWWLVVSEVIGSCGIALGYSAMPLLIMAAAPASQTGAANGLNALMRGLGLAVAGAVVSAVLARGQVAGWPTSEMLSAALWLGVLSGVLAAACAALVPRPAVPPPV